MANKKNAKFIKPNTDYMPQGNMEILQNNIEELGLCDYTLSKLKAVEIDKIIDLCRCQTKHLYHIDGIGKKNVFEIIKKLKNAGLSLKKSVHKDASEVSDNEETSIDINKSNASIEKNEKKNGSNVQQNNKEIVQVVENKDNKKNIENKKNKKEKRKEDNLQKINEKVAKQNAQNRKQKNKQVEQEPKRLKVNSFELDAYMNDSIVKTKNLKQEREEKIAKKISELQPLKNADGLYKFYRHGKWGYKNEEGKIVIEPKFSEAFNFREGLACVEIDERCGFIDKNGEIVIPIIYDTACSFSEGLASVTKNDKCGYIDKEGNVVFDFVYDSATSFENGISLVKKDGKWGYMGRTTGEIRPR